MRELFLIESGVLQADTGQTTIFEPPKWAKYAVFHFNAVTTPGTTNLTDLALRYCNPAITAATVVATTVGGGGGNDEVQTITLTGGPTHGTFTISWPGVAADVSVTTTPLSATASATEVQEALKRALGPPTAGTYFTGSRTQIAVTRSGSGTSGAPFVHTLTWSGNLVANTDVDPVTVDGQGLYTYAASALDIAGWNGITQIVETTTGYVQVQMGPGVTGIADDDTTALYSVNCNLPSRIAAVITLSRADADETYTYSLYADYSS